MSPRNFFKLIIQLCINIILYAIIYGAVNLHKIYYENNKYKYKFEHIVL